MVDNFRPFYFCYASVNHNRIWIVYVFVRWFVCWLVRRCVVSAYSNAKDIFIYATNFHYISHELRIVCVPWATVCYTVTLKLPICYFMVMINSRRWCQNQLEKCLSYNKAKMNLIYCVWSAKFRTKMNWFFWCFHVRCCFIDCYFIKEFVNVNASLRKNDNYDNTNYYGFV